MTTPASCDRDRELLETFCGESPPPVVIVAAHPDDEVIGAGARLMAISRIGFIHVTDGAPRNVKYARDAGFSDRRAYAAARRREWHAVLACLGLSPSCSNLLEVADQEAALDLANLTKRLAALLERSGPEIVVTHPYEGGHPDHDAVAFAAHAARRLLEARRKDVPVLIEMTSYHARYDGLATGEFLPPAGPEVVSLELSEREREFKRRLFDCYASQRDVLAAFPLQAESFRLAPDYDFQAPPHPGQLFYERFDWGTTGPRWREHAARALRELELDPKL